MRHRNWRVFMGYRQVTSGLYIENATAGILHGLSVSPWLAHTLEYLLSRPNDITWFNLLHSETFASEDEMLEELASYGITRKKGL